MVESLVLDALSMVLGQPRPRDAENEVRQLWERVGVVPESTVLRPSLFWVSGQEAATPSASGSASVLMRVSRPDS